MAALFIIAKTQKELKCSSTNEWIKKRESLSLSLSLPLAATWRKLDFILLSEVSQE